MSYYKYHSSDTSWITTIITFVISFALLLGIMFGVNACTAQEWNDGMCAKCHERYELRGVYKGMHYYSCPDCGNEVSRFGGR